MIWRDDDIFYKTRGGRLTKLLQVDDCFQRESVPHTIAVLAADIDKAPELVQAVKERGMIVQLHAWEHDDLTDSAAARGMLPQAVYSLTKAFGQRPTVLYPPWNRSNADVETAAAALGLTVSTRKVSLEQYIRFKGRTAEDTVNFHYWDDHELALLPQALALYRQERYPMKSTDYCPRAAPFDVYLQGKRGLVGVEVGVDAGAHAEALLRYYDIAQLYLVDKWPKDYHYGFCEGRLSALGFRGRFTMLQRASAYAVDHFQMGQLDFVYCDETRDGETASANLDRWWPLLKSGGVLGYRGYGSGDGVSQALDRFLHGHPEIQHHIEPGELILVKP